MLAETPLRLHFGGDFFPVHGNPIRARGAGLAGTAGDRIEPLAFRWPLPFKIPPTGAEIRIAPAGV